MILKTARRGALLAVAGAAAIALSACSAGQISQTADQVAAVDGASADTADGSIAVRDVTIIVNEDKTAALKFTAVNQDPAMKAHTLKSAKVDGKEVILSEKPKLENKCTIVADFKDNIKTLKKNDDICITYLDTKLENSGLAVGGQKPVVLEFDSGKVEVNATIATNHHQDAENNRVDAPKGH